MKLGTVIALFITLVASLYAKQERPNILWIIADDMSAHFSCYGETAIETPHLDRMAREGVMFTQAYVTAPVCSTSRSAFITGMYQTTIGSHHHRSGRGEYKIHLPEGVKIVPQLFQEAGYYTSIRGWRDRKDRPGKTDYNFEWDADLYDAVDWIGRKPGQPFFAQVQIPGGKLRGKEMEDFEKIQKIAEEELGSRTALGAGKLPPYYPAHPDIEADWAAYLDSVRVTDSTIGEVLALLEERGELENTVVLFMTDHGISHARGKQFLYQEGLHVPLVIMGPGVEQGDVRDDLVEHIDIAALSLGLAGIDIPEAMQAKDILAADYQPRVAVFGARDRCDETVEHIRSVTTSKFKFIRNYLHERPHMQPNRYKDNKLIVKTLRDLDASGKLNAMQHDLLFAPTRDPEELYDLENDPFETNNLANNPEYAGVLAKMRQQLGDWEEATDDKGRVPERSEIYDSDMATYQEKVDKSGEEQGNILRSNIALMKKWEAEGK
ncbi:sulfatase family protein [Pelagicoccus mobilis]|uniref:Sulfatase n=1 Tax=Pelagicoccus mobilis TaxID=415221 RepID=A0A934RRY4_9BACT|nr:sulfatase [Pelagicoccus mobilis]MBK1875777.1 sulfatase [Pelagicoccus mobilis]